MTTSAATRPAAPDASASRWRRVTPPVALAVVVLAASVLLHVRDPHERGTYALCPWLVLTGTYCPGCGGLRAVHDLTQGDLAAAFSSNALFVGSLPLLVFWWGRWFADRWRGVRRAVDARRGAILAGAVATVAAVFWVVRNLPTAGYLTP